MFAIGLLLSFIAGMCWLGFFVMRYKSGRIAKTPLVATGKAASDRRAAAGAKDAISVEGRFFHDKLLTSPVTNTPCVFYDLSVTAKWKAGDHEQSVSIVDEKQSVEVGVDDGSGPVRVDLHTGGDFDSAKKFEQTRGTLLGHAKFGPAEYTLYPGGRYNGIQVPDNAKFKVVERVLEPPVEAYVCGRMSDDGVIGSPKFASLIVSDKKRDVLLGATLKKMKIVAGVGAALTLIGPGLLGLNALFAEPEPEVTQSDVDPLAQAAIGAVVVTANERIEDTVVDHLPQSLAPLVDTPKNARSIELGGSLTEMEAPRKARVKGGWADGSTELRGVKPSVVLYFHNPAGDDGEDCPTLEQVEARLGDAKVTALQRASVPWTGQGPAYGDEIDLLLFERGPRAGFYVRKRFDHGDDYTDLCGAFGTMKSGFDMQKLGTPAQAREMAGALLTARENL